MSVRIYRNLHKQCYSVQTKVNGRWKVTSHAQRLSLQDVSFKVYETGRLRTIREKSKCVHAYILGTICDRENINNAQKIRYNPYIAGHFFLPNGMGIHHAKHVECNEDGVWA